MRDQLPLFKAGIWMLLAIILIVAFFFLVDRPLLSFKNAREEELVRIEQDEQQKEQLKKQEQELITALMKVNREINSLEADATGLLNRADVAKYIAAKAAEQQVKVSDLKIVGLKNNQGVWNVTYHVALDGVCANVLAVVKSLENAGQSRYVPGMSFLQQGPLKSQVQDWLNTPMYFTYNLQQQSHVTNYNYAYGSVQVPIVIANDKNQPAPYLRIKGLRYSDNTIRRYDWRLAEASLLVGDQQ